MITNEIEKLALIVNRKYTRLLNRVSQLEQNQTALNQVPDIIGLITLSVPLGYSTLTKAYKPLYVLPPESI